MKKLLSALLLSLALGFGLASAPVQPDYGPLIVNQFDRGAKTVSVHVILYETAEQVTAAKSKHDGKPSPLLYGWSAWSTGQPGEPASCDLHVVKAYRYRDPEFQTWGHELAHCLYGDYHPAVGRVVPRLSK